jgi:hypothetical protein
MDGKRPVYTQLMQPVVDEEPLVPLDVQQQQQSATADADGAPKAKRKLRVPWILVAALFVYGSFNLIALILVMLARDGQTEMRAAQEANCTAQVIAWSSSNGSKDFDPACNPSEFLWIALGNVGALVFAVGILFFYFLARLLRRLGMKFASFHVASLFFSIHQLPFGLLTGSIAFKFVANAYIIVPHSTHDALLRSCS